MTERITAEQVQSDVESYALRASPDGRRRVIGEALDRARREGGEDAAAEVARLREALEIACNWWGGCGHHADDCPVDADECKAAKRVNELAAKGAGR